MQTGIEKDQGLAVRLRQEVANAHLNHVKNRDTFSA
jgi:hypothetical protein